MGPLAACARTWTPALVPLTGGMDGVAGPAGRDLIGVVVCRLAGLEDCKHRILGECREEVWTLDLEQRGSFGLLITVGLGRSRGDADQSVSERDEHEAKTC